MNNNILIVEDELSIQSILKFNLKKEGFNVFVASTGEEAIKMVSDNIIDLVLMDIMLPVMDGYESTRRIREFSDVSIIMLTALDDESDKLKGFELGIDDYIVKPFSIKEVIARMKSNLSRIETLKKIQSNMLSSNNADITSKIITIGNLKINTETHTVRTKIKEFSLSEREYNLLMFLYKNANRVFNREKLLEEVWGYTCGDLRTIDVTIKRIREKVEENISSPNIIKTCRGLGYYLNAS